MQPGLPGLGAGLHITAAQRYPGCLLAGPLQHSRDRGDPAVSADVRAAGCTGFQVLVNPTHCSRRGPRQEAGSCREPCAVTEPACRHLRLRSSLGAAHPKLAALPHLVMAKCFWTRPSGGTRQECPDLGIHVLLGKRRPSHSHCHRPPCTMCSDTAVSPGPFKVLLPGHRLVHIPVCLWVDSVQLALGGLFCQDGAQPGVLRLPLPLPKQLQQRVSYVGQPITKSLTGVRLSRRMRSAAAAAAPIPQQLQ